MECNRVAPGLSLRLNRYPFPTLTRAVDGDLHDDTGLALVRLVVHLGMNDLEVWREVKATT